MAKKNSNLVHFHRSQIGRAQRYMRTHRHKNLDLKTIAREAGSSSFHFGRIFMAYTGETVFDFLKRIRLSSALQMLIEDPQAPVTEIALSTGYETPSAFNKMFKTTLNMTPTDFRNLGKAEREKVTYSLRKSPIMEVIQVNMTNKYEIVSRPATHFICVEKRGPFQEVAQIAWPEMFQVVMKSIDPSHIREFLGLSGIEKDKKTEEAMVYSAGLALAEEPAKVPKGAQYRKIKAGKYAKFTLTGSYLQIWPAFHQVFKILADNKIQLREEFCIENYVNNPETTPEEQLITEILVPVE